MQRLPYRLLCIDHLAHHGSPILHIFRNRLAAQPPDHVAGTQPEMFLYRFIGIDKAPVDDGSGAVPDYGGGDKTLLDAFKQVTVFAPGNICHVNTDFNKNKPEYPGKKGLNSPK